MLLSMYGDAPVELYPPIGFRWVVKSAYIELVSSATTGTRSATIRRKVRAGLPIVPTAVATIAETKSQTGVSTTYTAALTPTNSTSNLTNATQQTEEIVIAPTAESLSVIATLVSGDALTWFVVVDEVPNA